MSVRIIGDKELNDALRAIARNCKDTSLITIPLERSLTKFAHVDSGYMRQRIYRKSREVGSDAPYAGTEEERGGDHAFGTLAIDDFDMEAYADSVVGPY